MKVKIEQIIPDPDQPRKTFDDEHIENICNSISKHGFISQIVVRPHNGKYMIIAGENRYRAAKKAGLTEVECDVREAIDSDAREMQLIENYHRKDVPPIELAQAIKKLRDEKGITQAELGQRIGITQRRIGELESILEAASKIQSFVKDNKLDASTAYELTRIQDKKTQVELAEIVVEEELPRSKVRPMVSMAQENPDLSAKEIFVFAKHGVPSPPKKKKTKPHESHIPEIIKHLSFYIRQLENAEQNGEISYDNLVDSLQTFINVKAIAERMIKFVEVEGAKRK